MKDTGIVEQYVDLAEALQGSFDSVATLLGEAYVRENEKRLTAIRYDARNYLFATFCVTPRDRDCRSFAR